MTIDLNPHHLDTVRAILAEHAPDCEVMAFGSRAAWTARERSDLDLAVACGERAEAPIARLREAFEDSDLPIRVDVLDWHAVADSFRETIAPDCVVIQQAGAPSGWRKTTLGDVIVVSDAAYSREDQWPYIEYLDTGSITRNRIEGLQRLTIGRDKVPSRARRKVRPGDIVYSTVRPNQRHYGLLRDVPEHMLASTGFAVMRGKDGIADTGFLYCFLTQDRIVNHLQTIAEHSTSAYPSIRPHDILNLDITLPPLGEQRRIARVLGALDERIEANRRASAALEEMARALFRHWFVDFGPVRAKAAGLPLGLPPDLDALFPASLEASAQGEAPAGWGWAPLGEAIDVNPPRRLRRGDVAAHVEMAALPASGSQIGAWTRRAFTSGSRFTRGDTLLARITPSLENGKTALVDFLGEGETGWGSTEFIVLRPKPPWPPEFGYALARQPGFRDYAISNMTGTSGRQRVPAEAVGRYMLTVPPDSLAVAYGDLVRPWFERAASLSAQSRALAALRDTLLPRLLSGEVRAP